MAREEVLMTKYTCDGCGKEKVVPEDEETSGGWIEGTFVQRVAEDTFGPGEDAAVSGIWVSCSPRCIGRAVQNVRSDAYNERVVEARRRRIEEDED